MGCVLRIYLKYYIKNLSQAIYSIVFFVSSAALYGVAAIGVEQQTHLQEKQLVIHIIFLFSCLLSGSGLWQDEEKEGLFDQWRNWPLSLEVIVLIKILIHWISRILPNILLLPAAMLLVGIPANEMAHLALPLLIVSLPLTSLIASVEAMHSHQRSHLGLSTLYVLPMMVPLVFFSLSVASHRISTDIGFSGWPALIGMTLFLLPVTFIATAFLLKNRG